MSAADLDELVNGNTAFATDLYQQVINDPTQKGKNIVFSPLSISVAFGMQDAGALGKTAKQIGKVMHFTLPRQRLDAAFDALCLALAAEQNPKVKLAVVDRLFGQQDYAFKQEFLRELTRYYAAPMAAMDFKHQWEPSRKLINKWVADQTNQLIKNLIHKADPPIISWLTKLVLVNAIYLNAKWAVPFDPHDTIKQGSFYLADGKRVETPIMAQHYITAPYAITHDYTAVDLPYKGDQLSMLIVMPKDIGAFETSLDPAAIAAVIDSLDKDQVHLYMPRFSIRTDLMLAKALKDMGMKDAFQASAADFYGISDYPRNLPDGSPDMRASAAHLRGHPPGLHQDRREGHRGCCGHCDHRRQRRRRRGPDTDRRDQPSVHVVHPRP